MSGVTVQQIKYFLFSRTNATLSAKTLHGLHGHYADSLVLALQYPSLLDAGLLGHASLVSTMVSRTALLNTKSGT